MRSRTSLLAGSPENAQICAVLGVGVCPAWL
jgi:hypothetical protein